MKEYKDTLHLPATAFPMRGNLPQREPEIKARWDEIDLYEKLLKTNEGHPSFVLHDGPPFSNGNIHMGTSMNKVLKDFINKFKSMEGFYTPYVPGWDNHGMPIESAIIKQSKLDRKRMSIPEFRSACQAFAMKFVEQQKASFERLGVVGDWKHPYLTMNPSFEAKEVGVFGKMYENGYIYKGLKPVYWCAHDETALAEAEIEYQDAPCTSIYVKFRVSDDKGLLSGFDLQKTYFVIWTTTPWTLPGNVAIAVHPREAYCVVKANDEYYILAEALVNDTMQSAGIETFEIVKTGLIGQDLEYMTARHPFLDRDSLLCCAEYVTMDSGTGCVHTAPGYGAEDYLTGVKYKLDILVPVDDKGYQGEAAGKFAGLRYDESNAAILQDMKQSGALLASREIVHPYPHCWRCKHPIIFRATPQWFCSVEAFRQQAIDACDEVTWMPSWGKERMISMINERADWCISRQRHWGLPIPVFYCKECKKPICTQQTIARISELFGAYGSNCWFEKDAKELLPEGFVCPHCGGKAFEKETDTLDGWFDSGSTHFDVLDGREGLSRPADLYLEGGDQYRGWFQASLLTSVGAGVGHAPYKAVLTHGWTVDGEGKAMHKSAGNSVAPESVINVYGADILRLWVASSDYRVDVRCSDAIFKQLSESYRKIRNTCRILLANLGTVEGDFDPKKDMVPLDRLEEIDAWALSRLNGLVASARAAYERYEFHVICHDVLNFCAIDMSKLYIDITKDRLYCERLDDKKRRSAQTAMYLIVKTLAKLLAPILSYTAEELWSYIPLTEEDDPVSVFCNPLPAPNDAYAHPETEAKYEGLFHYRDDVMKALELARASKIIGKSLEAKVTIYGSAENEAMKLFSAHAKELEEVFIVSRVELSEKEPPANAFRETESGVAVAVEVAQGTKCVRCWAYRDDCEPDGDGQQLCARCRKAVC